MSSHVFCYMHLAILNAVFRTVLFTNYIVSKQIQIVDGAHVNLRCALHVGIIYMLYMSYDFVARCKSANPGHQHVVSKCCYMLLLYTVAGGDVSVCVCHQRVFIYLLFGFGVDNRLRVA